jgi:hypothetical protein
MISQNSLALLSVLALTDCDLSQSFWSLRRLGCLPLPALLADSAFGFRPFLRLGLDFSAPRCFGLGRPLSLFSPSRLGGLSLMYLAHGAFGFRRCKRPAILFRVTRRFGLNFSLGFLSPNRFRHLPLTLLSRGAFSPRCVLGLPFLFG